MFNTAGRREGTGRWEAESGTMEQICEGSSGRGAGMWGKEYELAALGRA